VRPCTGPSRLRKNVKDCLLTRAAQNRAHVLAGLTEPRQGLLSRDREGAVWPTPLSAACQAWPLNQRADGSPIE
jgi:hypothetical protein